MRKLSAHYVFNGLCFCKYAILTLDENNYVQSIESVPRPYREQASVEFYNGILCPRFAENCQLAIQNLYKIQCEGGNVNLETLLRNAMPNAKSVIGEKIGIICIENADLINLKLRRETTARVLVE